MLGARAVAGASSNFSFSASTIAHVISSWSAKIPWNSRSNVSDHKVNPSQHSVSSAVTRKRKRHRKPKHNQYDQESNHPIWSIKYRKNLRDALSERPTGYNIRDCDAIHFSSL